jgi:hypothetical protein
MIAKVQCILRDGTLDSLHARFEYVDFSESEVLDINALEKSMKSPTVAKIPINSPKISKVSWQDLVRQWRN